MLRRILAMASVILILAAPGWAGLQDGIIGYWPMDEGNGDKVADASGNGNDGTAENTNWVDGKYGKALEFDGAVSIVSIPYVPDMTPAEGATISAWVFPTDATRSCIAGQFGAYGVALLDGLQLKSVIWGDDWVMADQTIPAEEWSYIAMTWDVDNSERLIFLNGERVGERGNAIPIPVVQNDFGIGKWAAAFGWEDMFMGIIDDVKLWNRVLTADEISQAAQPAAAVEPQGKIATVWGKVKSSL